MIPGQNVPSRSRFPQSNTFTVTKVTHLLSRTLAVESGCLQFDVCEGTQGEFQVFLYEIYRTPADFDAHLAQPHFLQFNALTSPWVIDKGVQIFTRVGQCDGAEEPKHDS